MGVLAKDETTEVQYPACMQSTPAGHDHLRSARRARPTAGDALHGRAAHPGARRDRRARRLGQARCEFGLDRQGDERDLQGPATGTCHMYADFAAPEATK